MTCIQLLDVFYSISMFYALHTRAFTKTLSDYRHKILTLRLESNEAKGVGQGTVPGSRGLSVRSKVTHISRTVLSCSSLDFFSSISQSVCCPSSANNCLVMSSTSCQTHTARPTVKRAAGSDSSAPGRRGVAQTRLGCLSAVWLTCSCLGFLSFSFPVL